MIFKRLISIGLSAVTVTALLAACAPAKDRLDPAITVTSSVAQANAEWLDERLEVIPDDVVIGIGSNADYGIDMTDFDDDGYIARAIGGEVLLFGKTEEGLDRAVREYAKAADVGTTADLDTVYHEGARIKKLTIAGNDISEYTIIYNYDRDVKNSDAQAPTFGNARYAAEELQRLIEQATGINIEARPSEDNVTGPVISIDYYKGGDLGENGFTYKVEGGNIYIEGVGTANGCANAVYYLLEHECGWDALLYGDSDLRESDHVDIPEGTEKKVKPMFDWWRLYGMYVDKFDNDKSTFSDTYHGSVPTASHSLGSWSGTGNFCPTDESIYTTVRDKILYHIECSVDAGQLIGEDLIHIDLGMDDAVFFCQCTECLKVFREENKAIIGASMRMTNRIAEEMEEAGFYGIKYTVFAYAGLNVPCVTKPRDDVYVTYCMNGSCVNHLIDGSECTMDASADMARIIRNSDGSNKEYKEVNNDDFYKWMKGWGELADHVYLYIYYLPASFGQYSYFDNLYYDMQKIYEAGIEGYLTEAQYCGLGLNRLRFQLFMDIIWHPEMTKEEYEIRLEEHMRREYGDGYIFVEDYIDMWSATEADTGCWTSWLHEKLISTDTFDMEMYAECAPKMYGFLEEAMKGCNTADQESRIKRLMCDVLYKECYAQYFKAYDAGDTEKIEYLKGRYNLFVNYMVYCGYNFHRLPNLFTFGPVAYQPLGKPDRKVLSTTLEDAAWKDWYNRRDELSTEGAVQKPMPEKYAEYWETAEAE